MCFDRAAEAGAPHAVAGGEYACALHAAQYRLVSRNAHHGAVVHGGQFARRFGQRAADAAQMGIARKEALVGGLRGGDGFLTERAVFLEFDEAVQLLRPDAPFGDASALHVDDVDLCVLHHVIAIALVDMQRGQGLHQP